MIMRNLKKSERGAVGVELALAAPALFALVIGISQLGLMFATSTELEHAVEEGARVAAVWPTPTDAAITAAVTDAKFGYLGTAAAPVVTRNAADRSITIAMNHTMPLNFLFFEVGPLPLSHSRTVFVPEAYVAPSTGGGGGGGGGGKGGSDGKDKDKDKGGSDGGTDPGTGTGGETGGGSGTGTGDSTDTGSDKDKDKDKSGGSDSNPGSGGVTLPPSNGNNGKK